MIALNTLGKRLHEKLRAFVNHYPYGKDDFEFLIEDATVLRNLREAISPKVPSTDKFGFFSQNQTGSSSQSAREAPRPAGPSPV